MCNHFSGWLLRDRACWTQRSNSHTFIAEIHELHIDGCRGPNAVKFEALPPANAATWEDLSAWRVTFEQDSFPPWFNRVECAARARSVAATARAQDPMWWRVMTAASRDVIWSGEKRSAVLGGKPIIMPRADLPGANLTRADLTRAYLTGANLEGANLTAANLTAANLTAANLNGADLTGANYPSGVLPAGWVRDGAYLTRALAGRDVE